GGPSRNVCLNLISPLLTASTTSGCIAQTRGDCAPRSLGSTEGTAVVQLWSSCLYLLLSASDGTAHRPLGAAEELLNILPTPGLHEEEVKNRFLTERQVGKAWWDTFPE